MKRNKRQGTRVMRHGKGSPEGQSRYARKVASGKQMYGPGCCAHDLKAVRA